MSIYPSSAAPRLRLQVEQHSGQPIGRCYQCHKCSGGCPMSAQADLTIHEIIRLTLLGARDEVLSSQGIWMCTGCRTCQARCPNEIDGCRVKDSLRGMIAGGDEPSRDARIARFHASFLGTVKYLGRVHELSMMMWYKLRTRTYFEQLPLGIKMILKGKLSFVPRRARGQAEVFEIMKKAGERP